MTPRRSRPRLVAPLPALMVVVGLAIPACAPPSAAPLSASNAAPPGTAGGSRASSLHQAPNRQKTALQKARGLRALAVLRHQSAALAARDRAAFLADWADTPAAQRRGGEIYANLVSLDAATSDPQVMSGTTHCDATGWSMQVDISWRLAGSVDGSSAASIVYGFAARSDADVLTSAVAAPHSRLPIWLVPGLNVRRGARTLTVAGDAATAARVARLLREAVGAVGKVLPRWHGRLVAYAPRTTAQFTALLGGPARGYEGIAAVTTTVDGSALSTSPVAIVLNPGVFGTLGATGAHVVVAHEATHAATAAVTSAMPLWVAEGFADYVGIGSVHVPTAVAARAAFRVVRRSGPPVDLPKDAAFDRQADGLEAVYEESWLAMRLVATRYGRAALVAFYWAAEEHPDDLNAAFASVLHTTRGAFTVAWRRDLAGLAHAS